MIKGELKGAKLDSKYGLNVGHRPGVPIEPTFETVKDGCRYSSSCLTCPLPACRYEVPPSKAHRGQVLALQLFDAGFMATEAAAVVGVSERTVHRWAERRRAKGG